MPIYEEKDMLSCSTSRMLRGLRPVYLHRGTGFSSGADSKLEMLALREENEQLREVRGVGHHERKAVTLQATLNAARVEFDTVQSELAAVTHSKTALREQLESEKMESLKRYKATLAAEQKRV